MGTSGLNSDNISFSDVPYHAENTVLSFAHWALGVLMRDVDANFLSPAPVDAQNKE